MTFIFAGTDTTSSSLTFIVIEAFKRPGIVTRIRKEIEEFIPKHSEITINDLKKLHYL